VSDRTSADLFARLFDLLASERLLDTRGRREVAAEIWQESLGYDFHPCQMGCDDALVKLGLAHETAEETVYGPTASPSPIDYTARTESERTALQARLALAEAVVEAARWFVEHRPALMSRIDWGHLAETVAAYDAARAAPEHGPGRAGEEGA